jgi:transposase
VGDGGVERTRVLSVDEDVEAHALRRRGWTVAAIARHLERDPRTIKAYLEGERVAGARRAPADPFERFAEYCRVRLGDDPHLWARVLFDEVAGLGYQGGYSTFTRAVRRWGLRPHCEACSRASGRDVAVIDHPAGEETQFDWLELPDAPEAWGVGRCAHLLVGALSHSGRWRGVLAESEDFAHLVDALDQVVRRLGGVTAAWRFDRMATVFNHSRDQVTAQFAPVAKYYGAQVKICPPRRGNRKGVVEKANHSAAQRWWRTLPDESSVQAAQAGVDRLAAEMDGRRRIVDSVATTVGELASGEPLLVVPVLPFPAVTEVARLVSAQGLVSFEGNAYSVPPGLAGRQVVVRRRLGAEVLHLVTGTGAVVAEHRAAAPHTGAVVRDDGHVRALEAAVLASFSTAPPCPRKVRRPPSKEALAEADRLTGVPVAETAARVVIDMSAYVAAAGRPWRGASQDPDETEDQAQ